MAEVSHGELLARIEHVDKEVAVLKTEVHGELKHLRTTLDDVKTDTATNTKLAQEAVAAQTGQRMAMQYLGWIAGVVGTFAALVAML